MITIRVTEESPLVKRGYETTWDIPSDASRFCISTEGRWVQLCTFTADILEYLASESTYIVLECAELFTKLDSHPCLAKRDLKIVDRPMQESTFGRMDSATLYSDPGGYFISTLCSRKEMAEFVRTLDAVEIILVFWEELRPQSLLFTEAAFHGRFERVYLEHMHSYRAAAFLSRDHKDMEFMTVSPGVKAYLRDLVQ